MCRFWILVGLLATTLGCQGAVNPFAPYGPTQVPPPPTGCAKRADPYYRRAADDPRLSRRFDSDSYVPGSGLADRRASAGFRDEVRRDGSYDGASNFGGGDAAVTREPPEFNQSGAEFSDLRSSSNLGWRNPVTANDSFVAPAASFSGVPRPQFQTR